MEMHGAKAVYSPLKSLMHDSQTEDKEAQHDEVHRIIEIELLCMIRKWSELKLANGQPVISIRKDNAPLLDLEWTEGNQAKLKTLAPG